MPVSAIFYVYCCEWPVKPTHQVGRFYHKSFQNCHTAAIGENNRQVCPHQSVAKIGWRSNSPRSAYKIARCVTGFKKENEKFTVVRSRSAQNLKCGHFTLLFCRGRRKNVPKCKTHVQSDCLCSLNLFFCGVVIAVAVVVA